MTFLIYSINLILALLVIFPLLSFLKAGFGNSMLPDAMLKGFDFTSFTEFLRSVKGMSNNIVQARWMILFYFVVSIFFAGGMLFVFAKSEKFSIKTFLNGCVHYFFRFFKLFFYMLIFNLLDTLVVYLPLSLIINGVSDSVASEASLFYIVLFGVLIHLVLFIILQMIAYYTKIRIVSEDSRKVFRSIFKSIKFVFKNFISTFSLFLLQLVVPILLIVVILFLNNTIGMTSAITILIMFILQQMFVFSRVFVRMWIYASQFILYSEHNR
ncbi:MAG TPA: hypothetical protein DIW31_07835 [Bacteroidales bacterium]|nr:hypothetical protein [Bacteroidales bacterium]